MTHFDDFDVTDHIQAMAEEFAKELEGEPIKSIMEQIELIEEFAKDLQESINNEEDRDEQINIALAGFAQIISVNLHLIKMLASTLCVVMYQEQDDEGPASKRSEKKQDITTQVLGGL